MKDSSMTGKEISAGAGTGMDLSGVKVLVVGLGKSGISAARFLLARGAQVRGTDGAQRSSLSQAALSLEEMGIEIAAGGRFSEHFGWAEMILISPGVPHTLPPISEAAARGIPVIGEIELACRFIDAPILAITGTNGKTTVTELIGEMLSHSGIKVFVGGNIGNPLIDYVADIFNGMAPAQAIVAEVSSFQLDTIRQFHPKVSVLLNITPDHLDRYPDMEAYAESKARIFENQNESDTAILNRADPVILKHCPKIRARKLFFNAGAGEQGAFYRKNQLFLDTETVNTSMDISGTKLWGRHNLENIAAAALASHSMQGTLDGIQKGLLEFLPARHRLEWVAEIDGVRYYNDSKATNIDAADRALENFDGPVILIMGGRGKRGGYDLLRERVEEKVKELIVLGEAAEEIASAFFGRVPIRTVADLDAALHYAREKGGAGDTVLLSPACSSFDQYSSYGERGDHFCRIVKGFQKEKG